MIQQTTPAQPDTKTSVKVQIPTLRDDEEFKKPATPPMYAVILHNDNSTLPKFVQQVLVEAFRMESAAAWRMMVAVHHGTRGIVCIMAKDLAETRLAAAKRMISAARAEQDYFSFGGRVTHCELKFTIEAETKGDQS